LFVTAATAYFSNGLTPVWWLAWLAPLPALALVPRVSKLASLSVAFLGWSLGGLDWWGYLHKTIGIPLPLFILVVISPALAFGLGVLLARTFRSRFFLARCTRSPLRVGRV
jgi:apolipoprotein N-acyltransferase